MQPCSITAQWQEIRRPYLLSVCQITLFVLFYYWSSCGVKPIQDLNELPQATGTPGKQSAPTTLTATKKWRCTETETRQMSDEGAVNLWVWMQTGFPSRIASWAHPVLSVACSLLQGCLQPLSNTSRLLKLIHQLFSVLQLIRIDNRFKSCDVALAGLLQRGHRQGGQSFLMSQVSAWDTSRWHRFHQVTLFH